MDRNALLRELEAHQPFDETESGMWLRLRKFVEDHADCFSRGLKVGHITGSAWIVDESREYALLVYHKKLDKWLQPGGHCEDEDSVLETAWREATEETGIESIRPLDSRIFDVDVHPIPARGSEPGHLHYDVRYLFQADSRQKIIVSPESRAVEWLLMNQILERSPHESIRRLVEKTKLRASI